MVGEVNLVVGGIVASLLLAYDVWILSDRDLGRWTFWILLNITLLWECHSRAKVQLRWQKAHHACTVKRPRCQGLVGMHPAAAIQQCYLIVSIGVWLRREIRLWLGLSMSKFNYKATDKTTTWIIEPGETDLTKSSVDTRTIIQAKLTCNSVYIVMIQSPFDMSCASRMYGTARRFYKLWI